MAEVSFDNTEIAFKSKSNKELRRAYRLFKLVGKPSMVKFGEAMTKLVLKLRLLPRNLIRRTIFAHFCGGESIEDCKGRVDQLSGFGIGTILDYSVEGKTGDEDFEATTKEILDTIDKADQNPAIPFSVFKVTGIAPFSLLEKANDPSAELTQQERQEFAALHDRVDRICRRAAEAKTPVFIDAEESWIQDTIDRLAEAMMARYNKEFVAVYNTVQLYRHDRLAYLKACHSKARGQYKLGLKLVRGAYMEKERDRAEEKGYPSPIQPDKAASDRDFNAALNYCIEHLDDIVICAGTHNEESSLHLTKLMSSQGIPSNDTRVYFAQLLGMSDHISYNLAHAGYNVAKYVPYGPIREVIPYLLRRAQENTSVGGQMGRELSLIVKERKRRAKAGS